MSEVIDAKIKYLESAKIHMKDETGVMWNYAALDLRMCLESITYDNVSGLKLGIPIEILDTWQPPQMIKMLSDYIPSIDKGGKVFIGTDNDFENASFLGEYKTFPYRWLVKSYNSLGSYLHHPTKKQKKVSLDAKKKKLTDIIEKIQDVLSVNLFGASFYETISFRCDICNKPSIVSKEKLDRSEIVTCLNPNCGAQYYKDIESPEIEGKVNLKLYAKELKCVNCNKLFSIENRHIKVGYKFECCHCKAKYIINTNEFKYSLV